MARYIVGVDPGNAGGIAIYDKREGIMKTFKMPDTFPDIYNFFRDFVSEVGSADILAFMENVGHGMPGQSSSATAKFARHNGHLEMALYSVGIRVEMVTPQKWQKTYSNSIGTSKGLDKGSWKNRLKSEAQRRFPDNTITLWNADAVLIANYGASMHHE